jgi:sulfide:quinone oxidoreductase
MRGQPEQLAEPLRVLIAGGGVAGLEALLALHDLAGDRVELTLLSPEPDFVFRPSAVGSPFGRGHAERRPLADLAQTAAARVVAGELAEVDDGARCAVTATGERLEYDALLVAIGARSEAAYRSVSTWTPENDSEVFGGLLRDLEEGYVKQVAFVVPPGVGWSLPAYELALMTAWQVRGMGQDAVEVTVYTPEDAPLSMFGAAASAALRLELHEVAVRVETGVFVQEGADGLVLQPGDRPLETQRAVALPVAASRRVAGLPVDERGFIPCDLHGKV